MWWAQSKNAFVVGQRHKERKTFSIPRKLDKQPVQLLKWLILTRRAINKFLETGQFEKCTAEGAEAIATDDEE